MKLRNFLGAGIVLGVLSLSIISSPVLIQNLSQDEISTYWEDTDNPEIRPLLLASDVLTVSQYIDFQIKQGSTIITQTSKYIGNGFDEPGTGKEDTISYQFDVPSGSYTVYCRLRIEVEAVNLAIGTNSDDLVVTDERTFYGVYIENGQIIEANEDQFALCDTVNVNFKTYLPVIIKH